VIILLFNQFGNNSSGNVADTDSHEISTKFIGVLPFSNTKPDLETDYFGFAIADQIIGDLVYLKNIIVRPSSSIRKYEKEVIDSKTAGDELNVDYILTGNFLMEEKYLPMK
jgi:TolB-like protein